MPLEPIRARALKLRAGNQQEPRLLNNATTARPSYSWVDIQACECIRMRHLRYAELEPQEAQQKSGQATSFRVQSCDSDG